tara:strand:+ start:2070 stop:2669 length:600 start_codon:yes stop_codon:yes gene_type:complete
MKIVKKKIADLIGAEYNPRELTEKQHSDLTDSLKRFGIVDPVLVNVHPDRENIIIGGHQRTKVWGELGNEEIECVELKLTLDQEKELNIRLNKNTGQFNMDDLANFFDEDKLIEWGFETYEFGMGQAVNLDEKNEDDESFEIAGDDSGSTKQIESVKFKNFLIYVTEQESEMLEKAINEYVDNNGILTGFINKILENVN